MEIWNRLIISRKTVESCKVGREMSTPLIPRQRGKQIVAISITNRKNGRCPTLAGDTGGGKYKKQFQLRNSTPNGVVTAFRMIHSINMKFLRNY